MLTSATIEQQTEAFLASGNTISVIEPEIILSCDREATKERYLKGKDYSHRFESNLSLVDSFLCELGGD